MPKSYWFLTCRLGTVYWFEWSLLRIRGMWRRDCMALLLCPLRSSSRSHTLSPRRHPFVVSSTRMLLPARAVLQVSWFSVGSISRCCSVHSAPCRGGLNNPIRWSSTGLESPVGSSPAYCLLASSCCWKWSSQLQAWRTAHFLFQIAGRLVESVRNSYRLWARTRWKQLARSLHQLQQFLSPSCARSGCTVQPGNQTSVWASCANPYTNTC